MNRHFLGFGLFTLIVGVSVFAGAYFFKLSKPLREIPVSTVENIPPYSKKTSCGFESKAKQNRVTIDLEARKIFTEVDSTGFLKRNKGIALVTEIYEESAETRIYSTLSENFREEHSRLSSESGFDFYRNISPKKNYYARVWAYNNFAEKQISGRDRGRIIRDLLAENIPVTVFAGKNR